MSLQLTLKALSDPVRRRILELLKTKRMSATEIADQFSISAPAISRHLTLLKEAQLVRVTREGKYLWYELNASVLEEVLLWIASFELKKEKGALYEREKETSEC